MEKSLEVLAWDQKEAAEIAANQNPDLEVVSIEQKRKPKPATTCQTDNRPAQGAKKWVTKYYVYQCDEILSDDTAINMQFAAEADSKTEALTTAKDLVLVTQKPHTVRVVKVLADQSNVEANIRPRASVPGKFKVTCKVRQ